jgi:serum/glucocorticoid-regulated kinase 2
MSSENDANRNPFVVKLWWSFHDEYNLYLALDFHPGGDLATQLSKWGRLGRDRARFYTAEIVEGVEGLHAAGVIYRDLKPENVLLAQDGHIVLVDFGLAADFFPNQRKPGCILPQWMVANEAESTDTGRPQIHRHITDGLLNSEKDCCQSFVGTAEYLVRDFAPIQLCLRTNVCCSDALVLEQAPEIIRGLPYSYEVDW